MRCAIYRRVSTVDQAEEGFSLEAQRIRLEAYAQSQGWTIVHDYVDEGFSAKNTDRPQMKLLIQAIQQQAFDIVLVYRLDRFVRSVVDLHELLQLMEAHNVKFKSATELFDTTSATGRLFITMIATLAQWERETIAERVHMGMLKKAEEGFRNGAPPPYGYELVDGKLLINPTEARWVRYIFQRYVRVGALTIAKELNRRGIATKKGEIWSDFSVKYIVTNPIYTGTLRWNHRSNARGRIPNEAVYSELTQKDFTPIVSKEQFEKAQDAAGRRSKTAFRSDNHYPFSSVLTCARCGYRFTGSSKKRKDDTVYRFYKCRGRFHFGKCDMPAIAEEVIEHAFLIALELTNVELDISLEKHSTEDRDMLLDQEQVHQQWKQLTKKKERLEELYIHGHINQERFQLLRREITQEEQRLERQMPKGNEDNPQHLTVEQVQRSIERTKSILKSIKHMWGYFSNESKKHAIHTLFESLTLQLIQKAQPRKGQKVIVAFSNYRWRE